jgi:hypothetical protein
MMELTYWYKGKIEDSPDNVEFPMQAGDSWRCDFHNYEVY